MSGRTKNKNTNIFVKVEKILDQDELVKYWKFAANSRRRTCCISGCKQDTYRCVMVRITDGRSKGKLGFIIVCRDHAMNRTEELPVEKQSGIVFLGENEELKVMKKKTNPRKKKETTKKDI